MPKEPKSRQVSAGTVYTFKGVFEIDLTSYEDTRYSFHVHSHNDGPGNPIKVLGTLISELTEVRDWMDAHRESRA